MPRARLNWELTSFEKRSIRKIHELIGQQAGIAGIGRVKLMEFCKTNMIIPGRRLPVQDGTIWVRRE